MNRLEFLKILATAGIGVPLLSSFGTIAEKKIIYNNFPIVTDEFEVFNEALYQITEKDKFGHVSHYYKDGSFLRMGKDKNEFIHRFYPSNFVFLFIKNILSIEWLYNAERHKLCKRFCQRMLV